MWFKHSVCTTPRVGGLLRVECSGRDFALKRYSSFPATVVLPIYRRAAALWFGPSSLVFNDPDLRDFE
ncbi:uncharacterized protein LOC142767447 [Rhipicephalus microplus]|uniref:uncharacterized protein LOC142767447 n=1 Tax=Rhipicephalus microplus TaxID=6941 RepID=UPI003F6D9CCC